MFPIRDHNPSNRVPYVTYLLLVANVVVFFSYWSLFDSPRELHRFFFEWGMVPARLMAGEGWLTLLTAQFLHGGLLHLGFNLLFLWVFGDNMEEEWGHWKFLLFYLACGAIAGLLHLWSEPRSPVPMVGASGAIAGVLGGYLLMFPKARVDVFFFFIVFFKIIPIPAWIMLGIWFGLQLVGGMSSPAGVGGVAYWAHVGGFVAGVVLTVPIWLRRGGTAYWGRNFGQPPHPEARYRVGQTSIPSVRPKRPEMPSQTRKPRPDVTEVPRVHRR